MPDRYDLGNLIEKGFDVANLVQFKNGQPPLDEVSFVMGFMNCFGIIVGRVDIGLPQDVPLDKVLDAIHEDIVAFGRKVAANQGLQTAERERLNGFEK